MILYLSYNDQLIISVIGYIAVMKLDLPNSNQEKKCQLNLSTLCVTKKAKN